MSASRISSANSAENPRLLAALALAKRGMAVFPCRPKDKAPATRRGFKDATRDKAEIIRQWTVKPGANVAVATGAVSGVVVLDVNPRNGGEESLRELERLHGSLPETPCVLTGGDGRHLYFALPTNGLRSGKLANGLDIKADGGYVIAPPSTHPSGGSYRWKIGLSQMPLAPCPDWVRSQTRKKFAKQTPSSQEDAGQSPLGRAFSKLGMLGGPLEGGKYKVVCPWQERHSTGASLDSSTVIFPPSEPNGIGGFHCSHAHCAGRTNIEVLRELERRIAADDADKEWMAGLRRTPKGDVKNTFANIVKILTHDLEYAKKIQLDEMRGLVKFNDVDMTDATVSAIRVNIEGRYSIQPADIETARAVQLVASDNSFHPVRDYLTLLKWDGLRRLDSVASDILDVRAESDEERDLLSLLLRRWFISLVARPLCPGCKVDAALILEGAQGIGKSTFFRIVASDDWFSDTEMSLDKDALMQLRGTWVYEWAELENVLGRNTVSRVKAFISSTEDKFRPPFGRTPISVKRSGVIVGTTNNQDFLHDPSGSRRFWVVPVGSINAVPLRSQREQLLAEAVAAYRKGERYWLDDAEEACREAMASRFTESDPWEERVLEFAQRQEYVKTNEVLLQAIGLPLDKLTKRDEMRVSHILRRNGYGPGRSRLDGKVQRYWVLVRRK